MNGVMVAVGDSQSGREKVLLVTLMLATAILFIGLRIFFELCSAALFIPRVLQFLFSLICSTPLFILRGSLFLSVLIGFAILGVVSSVIFLVGQLFLWLTELLESKPEPNPKPRC